MKTPAITTYQYGTKRESNEGLRIGAAHYVPRGIKKEDWVKKGYFDYWLPLLSPDTEMIAKFKHGGISFKEFANAYKKRMKERDRAQVIELLAGIAEKTPISVGCFCEDETHCHRILLKELIIQAAADHAASLNATSKVSCAMREVERFTSPVCYADWDSEE